MADYLDNIQLYKDLPDQVILPSGVTWDMANADRTDWETNYKAQCVPIDDIVVYNTTFLRSNPYTELKGLIDGVVLKWSDVKYTESETGYTLYLLTANAV